MASLLELPSELSQLVFNCLRCGRLYPPPVHRTTHEWIVTARALRQTCKVLRDYIDGIVFADVEAQSLCEWNTSKLNALARSPRLSQLVESYHLAPTLYPTRPNRTLLNDDFFEDSYDPESQSKYPSHKELQQYNKKYSRGKEDLRLCCQQWLIIWSQPNLNSRKRVSSLYKSVTKRSHPPLTPIFTDSIYVTAPEMFLNLKTLIVTIPSYSDSCNLMPRVSEQTAIGLGQLLARKKLSILTLRIESINPQHVALIMKGTAFPSVAGDVGEATVAFLHTFTVESVQSLALLMYDRSQYNSQPISCPGRKARVWRDMDPQNGIGRLLAAFPNLKHLDMRFNSKNKPWSSSDGWLVLNKLSAPILPKLESALLIKLMIYPSELVKLTVQFVKKDHPIRDYSCHCRSLSTVDVFLISTTTELFKEPATQQKDKSMLDTSSEYLHATTWADVYCAWSRRLFSVMISASPSSEPVWRKSIFDNDMYLDVQPSELRITRQTEQDTKAFDDWHDFQYIRWPQYKGNPEAL